MTARSIRRAVERKQKKLARKAEQRNSPVMPANQANRNSAPSMRQAHRAICSPLCAFQRGPA
jgi:hypothetical protein